jgi:hypothetical protein
LYESKKVKKLSFRIPDKIFKSREKFSFRPENCDNFSTELLIGMKADLKFWKRLFFIMKTCSLVLNAKKDFLTQKKY